MLRTNYRAEKFFAQCALARQISKKKIMRVFGGSEERGWRPSRSSLGETHRRQLIRIIFILTAIILPVYAGFRILIGNSTIAGLVLALSGICLFCARRVRSARNLTPWAAGFLIPAFIFLVAFVATPDALSPTTFAWVYLMPVLSYLLLGRLMGFLVAFPFMAYIGVFSFLQLPPMGGRETWLVMANPVICALLIVFFMHFYETMRAEDRAKLDDLARTDELTGLANRRSLLSELRRTIDESNRTGMVFSLAIMDIDHFKQVNDSFGHDAGDEVLRSISSCLLGRLRQTDSVGRLGGEEFGIILRGTDNTDPAYDVIDELRDRIAGIRLNYGNHRITVTATFGIAHWPQDSVEANDLYQTADDRLYQGKRAGRNMTVSPR